MPCIPDSNLKHMFNSELFYLSMCELLYSYASQSVVHSDAYNIPFKRFWPDDCEK